MAQPSPPLLFTCCFSKETQVGCFALVFCFFSFHYGRESWRWLAQNVFTCQMLFLSHNQQCQSIEESSKYWPNHPPRTPDRSLTYPVTWPLSFVHGRPQTPYWPFKSALQWQHAIIQHSSNSSLATVTYHSSFVLFRCFVHASVPMFPVVCHWHLVHVQPPISDRRGT